MSHMKHTRENCLTKRERHEKKRVVRDASKKKLRRMVHHAVFGAPSMMGTGEGLVPVDASGLRELLDRISYRNMKLEAYARLVESILFDSPNVDIPPHIVDALTFLDKGITEADSWMKWANARREEGSR